MESAELNRLILNLLYELKVYKSKCFSQNTALPAILNMDPEARAKLTPFQVPVYPGMCFWQSQRPAAPSESVKKSTLCPRRGTEQNCGLMPRDIGSLCRARRGGSRPKPEHDSRASKSRTPHGRGLWRCHCELTSPPFC